MASPLPLTERQQQVLTFIEKYWAKHRISPSVRDIGDHCGISSPNGVQCHLKALIKKGMIEVYEKVGRGIVLTSRKSVKVQCPCCGEKFDWELKQ